MAITKTQVDAVVTVTQSMHQAVNQLQSFAVTVQKLMVSNWVSTINIGGTIVGTGSNVNATVSGADQATLLASYTALKATLVTLFNQLP